MQSFDIENFILKFRYPLLILLGGLIFIGGGVFFIKSGLNGVTKVEILGDSTATQSGRFITAEIAGEVLKPGVYKLSDGSRIDDILIVAGGFSQDADRIWTNKYLNRAAKLIDGQKVYIPKNGEQSGGGTAKKSGGDQSVSSIFSSDSNTLININLASLSQLDTLPGIGPVYGQNIIDHRPYSNVEELLSKGVLKKNVFEKIKDSISVY